MISDSLETEKPCQLAGLFLDQSIQAQPKTIGPFNSRMAQVERRLPKGHTGTNADVDALFDAILRHLDHLIACVQHFAGDPSHLVAEHDGPAFRS